MIYFYTNQTSIEDFHDITCVKTKEPVKEFIDNNDVIALDTETTGFDPHTKELLTVQLGNQHEQHVIQFDGDTEYLKALTRNKLILMHNAKFDLRWLMKYDIYPEMVYDTQLAEKLIRNSNKASLYDVVLKYCNVELDKSIRGDIHKEGLTQRVVQYAGDDVKYLHQVRNHQLENHPNKRSLDLENQFVKVLAYVEYHGFGLNTSAWMHRHKDDLKKHSELEQELNSYVLKKKYFDFINPTIDLFTNEVTVTLNWNSPLQVTKFFEREGLNLTITEKGKEKKTSDIKFLEKKYRGESVVDLFVEYKKLQKAITSYGKDYLKYVNPQTHRLHPNYWQLLVTTRMSQKDPNLQQVPKKQEYRDAFTCKRDRALITADYSQQEPRTLASMSQDPDLLNFFKHGDGDIHSFVASKLFTVINGKPTTITKENPKERFIGKTMNLKLNYGGSAYTVKDDLKVSQDEAQKFIDALKRAFPTKERWFKNKQDETFFNGYILANNITWLKIYVPEIDAYNQLAKKKHESGWESLSRSERSELYTLKGDIERMSMNYPIQATGAQMIKTALIYFYKWIIDNNKLNNVLICNIIHDEIVIECDLDEAQLVADNLQECMEKAASIFCTNIEIPAQPQIDRKWIKD